MEEVTACNLGEHRARLQMSRLSLESSWTYLMMLMSVSLGASEIDIVRFGCKGCRVISCLKVIPSQDTLVRGRV